MKNPEVFIRSDCTRCDGTGEVPGSAVRLEGEPGSLRAEGKPGECHQCKGNGKIAFWMPMEDFLSNIAAVDEAQLGPGYGSMRRGVLKWRDQDEHQS